MKYNITGQVTVSCYTEVEAASISQAILIAQERSLASLSNNCFSGEVDECWHIDTDGEPTEIKLED